MILCVLKREHIDLSRYSKSPNAEDVYVTGSMTDWQCVKMSKPPGEAAWVHIIDTRNVL